MRALKCGLLYPMVAIYALWPDPTAKLDSEAPPHVSFPFLPRASSYWPPGQIFEDKKGRSSF
jgi:hypothetical protein